MATDRWIRASDQDRQSAVESLSEAYAVGRLRREELDERATAARSRRYVGCRAGAHQRRWGNR
jgi:Domain of unknown function (DUF1707)